MRRIVNVLASLLCGLVSLAAWAQTSSPDLSVNPAAEAGALNPTLPTIFIAGDSTAARNNGNPTQGWGVPFADYWEPSRVNVANLARGGRSSRTFITEGLWDQLLAQVKAGDVVLIQFGHNDGGAINEEPPGSTRPLRARGTLPGLSERTETIDNVLTKKREVVHTYGWYIRKMIADVRAKGGRPVLLSLTLRAIWKEGQIERASGGYRAWNRELAEVEAVPFVDLSRILADDYQELGEAGVKALFGNDHTHTNTAGADYNAARVVAGLRGLRTLRFEDWLSEKGRSVKADTIGWLNLPEPARDGRRMLLLIGDSTVRNGRGDGSNGEWGWGDFLAGPLGRPDYEIVNRAVGGLSSRTFRTEGHWRRALQFVRPGDTLVLQFGHNDNSPVNDDKRARGTLAGTGEETEPILNRLTGRDEVVHTYGWYLRQYVREAKDRGAQVVICSPVPRKKWEGERVARLSAGYPQWAETVAREEGAAFIALHDRVADRYEQLGRVTVESLFADEHTHTNAIGAGLNATLVAEALRALLKDAPTAP